MTPSHLLRHTMSNGVRLIAEKLPHAQSAALSLTLARGSRHEAAAQLGMAHFCEHLLFKGTDRHDAAALARAINRLGGHVNACTGPDSIKLYNRVVHGDLPVAMELMAGMFLDSTFPDHEVDRERDVILEEIAMYEDTPDDLCFEHFTQALLLPHPAGRPVLGPPEQIAGHSAPALRQYWRDSLDPAQVVLSVAGRFDEAALVAQAEALLGGIAPVATPAAAPEDPAPARRAVVSLDRDLEQFNFCLGVTGPRAGHPARYAWALYDTILGGGMGSRLFDEVREKRGLAYSIGSSITALHGIGYLAVSGSTRPESVATALRICREQLQRLAEEIVPDEEFSIARQQIERSVLLSDESTSAHASVNGDREIYGLPHLTTEQSLAQLAAVVPADLLAVGREVAEYGSPALCVVGPLDQAGDWATGASS